MRRAFTALFFSYALFPFSSAANASNQIVILQCRNDAEHVKLVATIATGQPENGTRKLEHTGSVSLSTETRNDTSTGVPAGSHVSTQTYVVEMATRREGSSAPFGKPLTENRLLISGVNNTRGTSDQVFHQRDSLNEIQIYSTSYRGRDGAIFAPTFSAQLVTRHHAIGLAVGHSIMEDSPTSLASRIETTARGPMPITCTSTIF